MRMNEALVAASTAGFQGIASIEVMQRVEAKFRRLILRWSDLMQSRS